MTVKQKKESWHISSPRTLISWFQKHAKSVGGGYGTSRLVVEALEIYPAMGAEMVRALRRRAQNQGVPVAQVVVELIRSGMDHAP